MVTPDCPNGQALVEHARRLGAENVRLEYHVAYGWILKGDGYKKFEKDGWPIPIVWQAARDCGVTHGGGSTGEIQVRPERYRPPDGRATS